MFHRHRWTDWSITGRGDVKDKLGHIIIGSYLTQSRFCPKCSKTQIDIQSTVRLMPNSYCLVSISNKVTPKHDVRKTS